MKKHLGIFVTLIFCVSLLAFVFPVVAKQITVTLEWDANVESNLAGYGVYVGDAAGGPYTKFNEVAAGTETVDYVYDAVLGTEVIKYFVVDAFNTEELRSGMSNEVNWTYDMMPIVAATEFSATLDGDDVTFTWKQSDIERVKEWKLYVKEGTAEFAELAVIPYSGTPGEQYSTVTTMNVPAGEKKTFIFSLVTFTMNDVYSPNSSEISVMINKIPPVPVYNLKIKIKVQ